MKIESANMGKKENERKKTKDILPRISTRKCPDQLELDQPI